MKFRVLVRIPHDNPPLYLSKPGGGLYINPKIKEYKNTISDSIVELGLKIESEGSYEFNITYNFSDYHRFEAFKLNSLNKVTEDTISRALSYDDGLNIVVFTQKDITTEHDYLSVEIIKYVDPA